MASTGSQTAIVGVRAFSSDGIQLLRQALKALGKVVPVAEVSSVYRVAVESESTTHVHDLRSLSVFYGFVVAARCLTTQTPEDFSTELKEIEASFRSEALRQRVALSLYFFGPTVKMTPELTIPDPEVHLNAAAMVTAAEVGGEFEHPVLHKTLKSLAAPLAVGRWGEFVAQGKAMLDF